MWRKTCEATALALDALAVLLEQLGQLLLVPRRHRQQQLGHDVGELGQPDVEGPALLDLGLEAAHPAAQVERLPRLRRAQPLDHAWTLSHLHVSIPRPAEPPSTASGSLTSAASPGARSSHQRAPARPPAGAVGAASRAAAGRSRRHRPGPGTPGAAGPRPRRPTPSGPTATGAAAPPGRGCRRGAGPPG